MQCAAVGGGNAKSYKMDLSQLTKIVADRIQKLDPGNVRELMRFILFKAPSEQEMMKLAFGPETALHSKISEAKITLGLLSPNSSVSSQNIGFAPRTYPREDDSLLKYLQFLNFEEKMGSSSSVGNHCYNQDSSFNGSSSSTTSRSPSLPEFEVKACHYFNKGFCIHGENCRYYHGHSQGFDSHNNEFQSEGNGFSPKSLEKLEMEIVELLKSQKGAPVSISSLPSLYYEKYGRILRADGYLTESQWHGKAGFGLTKLLARLRNSIRLIDWPYGQHSIILGEDAAKYLECQHEKSEAASTSASSHQIYLTFSGDSKFHVDDIFNYFKQFGPVKDVRIPVQEKRMYGFVSFLYPKTVCDILMMKKAHYIRGYRVRVKPYKEKSRIVDRSYNEKNKVSMHPPYQHFDLDSELFGSSSSLIPRKDDSSRMIKLQLEEQQKMVELERNRLAHFNLVQGPPNQQSYINHDSNRFAFEEDHLGNTPNVLNTELSSHVNTRNTGNNYSHKESGYFELPENPFGSGSSS